MRVGLDIDNVISDFDSKILEEFFIEDKNKRNKGIVNKEGHWIRDCFDWSKEEIDDFFNNNMERIAKTLELKKDAKKYMDKLLEEGYELYLISHRVYPHYNFPYETTTNWLKDKEVNYTRLILSETTNKSKECLENNIDIMFDDVKRNCHDLLDNGIKCYLVSTNYNHSNREGLEVVNNWDEIYNKIKEVLK